MSQHSLSKEILDDITIRFVIGAPEFIRLHPEEYFFVIEEAFWFALDFYDAQHTTLLGFAMQLLQHNGIFLDTEHDYGVFKAYKQSIRVYGTMIFSRGFTHCLLVQQQGSSTAITFPKGKKSRDETGIECAIRETMEEVGYDVSDKIVDMSVTIFDKITLYFVFNVSLETEFTTHTRNEISKIFWFDLRKIAAAKTKSNYRLFCMAYVQAAKVIDGLKKNAFKFDMSKIDRAIESAMSRAD